MGSPIKYLRDAAPAHYKFQIENFSALAKLDLEKYESRTFSAGGYKWALVLYPNGNKRGKDHISLDLTLVDKESITKGSEILVDAKMFVFDHDKDQYLTIQDGNKVWRFHDAKTKWGFDELITLKEFKASDKGYLNNDSCIFGVELFIVKNTGMGESLRINPSTTPKILTWKVDNYSKLDEKMLISKVYDIGGSKWNLRFFPKGDETARGKKITLYLRIADSSTISPEKIFHMEFYFRVKNQFGHSNYQTQVKKSFSKETLSTGRDLLSLSLVNDKSKGWVVDGVLILELEVTAWSCVNDFS